MNDEWQELEIIMYILPMTKLLSYIEDALVYHFEFKVENHRIYYREVTDPSEYDIK